MKSGKHFAAFLLLWLLISHTLMFVAGVKSERTKHENTTSTVPVEISAKVCLKVPNADDGDLIVKPGHTIDYIHNTWFIDNVVVATSVPAEDSAFEACGSPEIINAITIG